MRNQFLALLITILVICLQIQISNSDVINITVLLPSNTQVTTTIKESIIVTQSSSPITNQPDFFHDKEAVNTFIALIITILTAITTIIGIIFSCKRKLRKHKQAITRLQQNQSLPQYSANLLG